jgi:hypothetical protein
LEEHRRSFSVLKFGRTVALRTPTFVGLFSVLLWGYIEHSKNEREDHGQCGDITSCSHGLPPTRFGNSSEKVVHQIRASAVANVTDGLLDLHDT